MSEVVPPSVEVALEADAQAQTAEVETSSNLMRTEATRQTTTDQTTPHREVQEQHVGSEPGVENNLLRLVQQDGVQGGELAQGRAEASKTPDALQAMPETSDDVRSLSTTEPGHLTDVQEAPEEHGTSDVPEEREVITGGFSDKVRLPYPNAPHVRPQGMNDDCLPTSVGMVADSFGLTDPQYGGSLKTSRISSALQGQNGQNWKRIYDAPPGGPVTRVTDIFPALRFPIPYDARDNVTIQDLANATQKGPAIVSLDVPKGLNVPLAAPGDYANLGRHAVVVDKIDNGVVYIRDPRGTAYGVPVSVFLGNYAGTAVANQPNEWARYNGTAALPK
jgi:hypothetical protein